MSHFAVQRCVPLGRSGEDGRLAGTTSMPTVDIWSRLVVSRMLWVLFASVVVLAPSARFVLIERGRYDPWLRGWIPWLNCGSGPPYRNIPDPWFAVVARNECAVADQLPLNCGAGGVYWTNGVRVSPNRVAANIVVVVPFLPNGNRRRRGKRPEVHTLLALTLGAFGLFAVGRLVAHAFGSLSLHFVDAAVATVLALIIRAVEVQWLRVRMVLCACIVLLWPCFESRRVELGLLSEPADVTIVSVAIVYVIGVALHYLTRRGAGGDDLGGDDLGSGGHDPGGT